jgi:riboflavin kinase / FMN adenylyltransferase
MKVYSSPEEFEFEKPVVATMGTFDGVHLGHKTILQRLKDVAKEKDGESLVVTYHPHPRIVLMPEENPVRLLQTLEERIITLEKFGIDKLLIIPFTLDFSKWSSERFIQEILLETVHIRHIIIGYDHHFGHDRKGGLEELRKAGVRAGFEVEEIPAQQINDNNVSSTRIRRALETGDLEIAERYLGYPYQFSGKVVHGDHRGRLLGFPTANLEPLNEFKLIPANGVYAVEIDFLKETYYGMMNIGVKPTFGGHRLSIEVHLFNFNLNLYHEHLTVRFIRKIREERKFESLDALKEQLSADQESCYRIFGLN